MLVFNLLLKLLSPDIGDQYYRDHSDSHDLILISLPRWLRARKTLSLL